MRALVVAVICVAALHGQARTFQTGERVEIATFPTEDAADEAIILAAPGDAVQMSRDGMVEMVNLRATSRRRFSNYFPASQST